MEEQNRNKETAPGEARRPSSVEEAEAAGQVSAVGDDVDAAGGDGVPQQARWQGGATGDLGPAADVFHGAASVSSTTPPSTTPASMGSSPALRCEGPQVP